MKKNIKERNLIRKQQFSLAEVGTVSKQSPGRRIGHHYLLT